MIRMILITLLLAGGTALVTYFAQHLGRRLLSPKPGRWVRPAKQYLPDDWNPWKITEDAPQLTSPDGSKRIRYYALQALEHNAPLRGECIVETPQGDIRIGNACGCPPVWSTCGRYVALPLWTPEM